jgi:hypothetical protein
VERAIAELGYRRNTAARSLVTRRSQIIGVLGIDIGHYGPANTLLGVKQAARFTAVDGQRFVTTNRLADFSRTPVKSYFQAPGLGEHSLELLRQFGADEQTIRELVQANTLIDGEPAAITYLPPYR